MDIHTPKQRSYNMSRIQGKDSKPELIVRKLLWENGYRYRLHKKNLPGKPDIVFGGRRKVIFVHGCFWHKHDCKYFKWPSSNVEFWKKKINDTVKRDEQNCKKLSSTGWKYMILWECEIKEKDSSVLYKRLTEFLNDSISKK